jgi:hypothetical protein
VRSPLNGEVDMPGRDAGEVLVQPVILAVDDEPAVLRAIVGDLRRHYARRYRVIRSESGEEALEGIIVVRDYAEEVPVVVGSGGELNQVWTNDQHRALVP